MKSLKLMLEIQYCNTGDPSGDLNTRKETKQAQLMLRVVLL